MEGDKKLAKSFLESENKFWESIVYSAWTLIEKRSIACWERVLIKKCFHCL